MNENIIPIGMIVITTTGIIALAKYKVAKVFGCFEDD